MWQYKKKLQYPVNIKNPNPKYAQIIISQNHGEPVFSRKSKAELCYANICARINGEEIPILCESRRKNHLRFFFDVKMPSRREA